MTTTIAAPPAAKMTLDEYLALDELDDGVWELVDGVPEKMPSPNLDHQTLIGILFWMMRAYLIGIVPAPGMAIQGVSVALSQFRAPVPDLVYVRTERMGILRGLIVNGAPDIVVEILSQDRAKDLIRNRQWYAEAGIPEYWILDPVHDTLTILELAGDRYIEKAVLTADDTLTTPALPGFALPLTQLFHDPERLRLRAG